MSTDSALTLFDTTDASVSQSLAQITASTQVTPACNCWGSATTGCATCPLRRTIVLPVPLARTTDPQTSHAAARTVNVVKSTAYTLTLLAELQPCTAEDLERAAAARGAQWRPSRIRSALTDLVRMGRAVRVLPDGVTSSGRPARRWRSA